MIFSRYAFLVLSMAFSARFQLGDIGKIMLCYVWNRLPGVTQICGRRLCQTAHRLTLNVARIEQNQAVRARESSVQHGGCIRSRLCSLG